MKRLAFLWLMIVNAVYAQPPVPAPAGSPAAITIDYTAQDHALSSFWAFFGYDEPNYTYMRDGRLLLSELAALSAVPVYVRCHNLLTTGDGSADLKWGSTNAYTEDASGRPVYDWHIVDSIFDLYMALGMKPLAEIGFMPEALSVHPEPYRHHWHPGVRYDSIYTGWAWPPVDYGKWGRLVEAWVRHCVSRYGAREVGSWLWEVWNEPNISYWKGTEEEYFRLYDTTAAAVKRALPSARVGGPATTGPGGANAARWLRDFLAHCADRGAPLDFVSFHAKGSPRMVDGHVRMNMVPQLNDVRQGLGIVKGSSFASLPVYITECDPEGCAACGMATNPENAYRNGTMYSSYTAASFSRIAALADSMGVKLAGATSWSFEFEGQKWFDGFRDLATNGIDKPVLNAFRMFGMMRGNHIRTDADRVYASAEKHSIWVMIWNYADDDLPGRGLKTRIRFSHLPASRVKIALYSIDQDHSNAYTAWKRMGSPQEPTGEQYRELARACQLQQVGGSRGMAVMKGAFGYDVELPAQAVYLLRLDF